VIGAEFDHFPARVFRNHSSQQGWHHRSIAGT
jgi:hypothetical protein